jgi:hypothetical protein
MTTYSIRLETPTHLAKFRLEADCLDQALEHASDRFEIDPYQFDWEAFDFIDRVTEITAHDPATGRNLSWTAPREQAACHATELLEALEALVERERTEAAQSGFTDDEMTWLEDARRVIARAKPTAS